MLTRSIRRRRMLGALFMAALGPSLGQAIAQSQPPLRVILPVSAGSGIAVIARSAQPALIKALDAPMKRSWLPVGL